jgi:hypothetical protein
MELFFKKNGFVGGITIIVIVVAIIAILWNKFMNNRGGVENMNNPANWYGNQPPAAFNGKKQNSSVSNYQSINPNPNASPINSNDLLPKDKNSEWAQLNPSGSGELSNISFLKSGWQIGVDTVGQSLRNANLQLRSEPANPQTPTGPWNQSTITHDYMRVPLEIGQGQQ